MSKHAFIIDVTGREHFEKWRPIPGYEGLYEASNLGRLRSVDRIIIDRRNKRLFRGKVLKQRIGKHGYPVATLSKNNHAPECLVHRHVLAAFHGKPRNGQECCHINGIRTDNHIDNLRWDSRSANEFDKIRHGTHHNGSKTHCKRGHLFDDANTHIRRDGSRLCRKCKRIMSNAWYHRQSHRNR